MNIKVKEVVKYGGHSLSANGSVNFTLKATYSELPNTIKLMQMLNNDVVIKAKVPSGSPMKLGYFRVKQIVIDGDGELRALTDEAHADLYFITIAGENSGANLRFIVSVDGMEQVLITY